MRNTLLVIAMSTLLAGTALLRAQPKGERITVKGEVVDLWCYLEGGDRGPAKKQCATACAKAGNPIGILDAAQLVTARDVVAGGRLEPRLVHLAGDRVVLAAEVGDPPRVDHVPPRGGVRGDLQQWLGDRVVDVAPMPGLAVYDD